MYNSGYINIFKNCIKIITRDNLVVAEYWLGLI